MIQMKRRWMGLLFGVLGMVGCGQNTSSSEIPRDETHLQMGFVYPPDLPASVQGDSVQLMLSGPGMVTQNQKLPLDSMVLLTGLASGPGRLLQVSVFRRDGMLLFQGDSTLDFNGGEELLLKLKLQQKFGSVRAKMPLPLAGSSVSGGVMRLVRGDSIFTDTLSFDPSRMGFTLLPLPFGVYQVQVRLWNANGDTTYVYNGALELKQGQQQNLVYRLESVLTDLKLQLSMVAEWSGVVDFVWPDSKQRIPSVYGDLMITEIMPNPGSAGDSLEYFELYNPTIDTLHLAGCSMRKTRGSTAASTNLNFDSLLIPLRILPGKLMVFGREKASFADAKYTGFGMTNTNQEMLLFCGNTLVDSLSYRDSTGLFALGVAQQIHPQRMLQRNLSSSWCRSMDVLNGPGTLKLGSPSFLGQCQ